MISKTNIVIVGTGMVGLSCALALADSEFSVMLISETCPKPANIAENQDTVRVSAINQAVVNAYKSLDVWSLITEQRVTAYTGMEVWDKANIGKIQFDSHDVHQDELGWIIENDVITWALWQKLQAADNISFKQNTIKQINSDNDTSLLVLDDGQVIQAELVIAADGAQSAIRTFLDIPLTYSDYGQQAIVANIKTEKPHLRIARQAFSPSGPLAFLPLYEDNLSSIVFSQDNEQVAELMAMSEQEFANKLTATFDGVLGNVESVSKRLTFPLRMRYARDFIKNNVVLIGDAAHTIHPLAGQGANLGIMDALAISENLLLHKKVDRLELEKTMRWRKSEAFDRIAAMEAFHRLFANEHAPLKLLRGIGLELANNIKPLKQKLIAEAMGITGHLPELARSQEC